MTRNSSEMSLKEESKDVLRNPYLTVCSSAVRKIMLQEVVTPMICCVT